MLQRVSDFLQEYLRINAIRRMLGVVEVRRSEILGLAGLAVLFAIFEGVGLTLLLPILQYAEGGQTAIIESSGVIWESIAGVMAFLQLPLSLPVLLLMAFVPILLRQVVFYLNAWYSTVVAGRIGVRMRMQTFGAVLNADPSFFSKRSVGEVTGVVVNQTGVAGQAVLALIKQLSTALLMLLYVVLMLALSVPLTLITLVFALFISAAVNANIVKMRTFGTEAAQLSQDLVARIIERVGMIRLIKLRDMKEAEFSRVAYFSESLKGIGVRQARLAANIEVTADPLLMLSVFVTLYLGIAVFGMTLSQLGLLLFVLNRLNAKVKEFNAGRQAISMSVPGLVMVREMTDDALASNTIRSGSRMFEGLREAIEFNHVDFEYPDHKVPDGAGTPILHDLTFRIPAGSFTALVGRSGGGKSTMVELLPRFRDVTGGSITFDGTNLKEFDVGSLRKGIGFLSQTPELFPGTVRENLLYGLGFDATDDQINDALEAAYASFVLNLPDGLETELGGRGVHLSGGERQRVSLARVLLENTSLIILDEPTSALDSESESYIQSALAQLHGRKTIVVIAHRLATVIEADQLLVMQEGRIVESGTHAELVSRGTAYQNLFESQLR